MQDKPISNSQVILFTVLWNYLFLGYYFLNNFVKEYQNSLFIFSLIFLLISIILLIPIKSFNNKSLILKKIIQKPIISISLALYCFINIILNIIIGLKYYNVMLIYKIPNLILISILLITIIILAKRCVKNIISVSFLFIFFSIILMILFFIIDFNIIDLSMLKPFTYKFKFDYIVYFYLLFLALEPYIIIITSNVYDKKYTKKSMFFSILITFILYFINSIDLIGSYGVNFLLNNEFLILNIFEVQQTFGYLGDLNFLFLVITTIIIIFKGSYYLYLFNKLLKIKNNKYSDIIIIIFLYISIYFLNMNYIYLNNIFSYIIIISIILILPYYLFLIFRKKDEVSYE